MAYKFAGIVTGTDRHQEEAQRWRVELASQQLLAVPASKDSSPASSAGPTKLSRVRTFVYVTNLASSVSLRFQ